MTIGNDDNWLQRRYFTWAERHYRRMPPGTRAEVERIDRWLYSWHGAGIWLSLAVALVASIFGLEAAGLLLIPAIGAGLGTRFMILVGGQAPGCSLSDSPAARRCAPASRCRCSSTSAPTPTCRLGYRGRRRPRRRDLGGRPA